MDPRSPTTAVVDLFRGASRRALATVLAAGVMVAPFSFGSASAAAECDQPISNSWVTIDAPAFSRGGPAISAHAVDPASKDVLYATNGSVVAVSRDGGCKWKETFSSTAQLPGGSATITSIVTSQPGRALLLIKEDAAVSRPRVVRSNDGGASWQEAGAGLPPTGRPTFLSAAPSNPLVQYLGVSLGGDSVDLLFASTDGGASFVLRSEPTDLRPTVNIAGLEADPLDAETLWAYGPGGLFRSGNGGRSFTLVDEFTGQQVSVVDVFHAPGSPARIAAATPQTGESVVSTDGGDTWFRNPVPSPVDSAAHGATSGEIVITAGGIVYGYHEPSFEWVNLQAPSSDVTGMVAQRAGSVTYFGHSSSAILHYTGLADPVLPGPGPIDIGRDVSLLTPPEIAAREATLTPDGRTIRLKAGATKTVTYELDLPKRPLPLDVFFLVDTSDSMTRTLDGLALSLEGIINELLLERIDVEFGIAEYRAYPRRRVPPNPNPFFDEPNFIYRRLQNIAGVNPGLARAIEGLEPSGGGTYDAQLGALYQAATGEGQSASSLGPAPQGSPNNRDVPPGQQATFRQKSLRVVINATDEAFGDSDGGGGPGNFEGPSPTNFEPPPDIPSFDEVIGAFNARDIKHVGISIGRAPLKDLRTVSTGTGTFAEGAVDCDGNGVADIAGGDSLVCPLKLGRSSDAINLVPAVVGLLKAVQEQVPIGMEVVRGEEVVRDVTPESYEGVVLQTSNDLTFDVEFGCTKSQAGERFPVRLKPVSNFDLSTVSVTAEVICAKEKVIDDVLPPPPASVFAVPLVSLAVPPPPPPPPPATELGPASQTQAQSQAQAQGAAAQQEQEEPQFAYVTAFEAEEDIQFAMSVYEPRRRDLPASAVLGVGAVAVSMMFGLGYSLRRRVQVQRARH